MTPEEILSALRDIAPPAPPAGQAGFTPIPLLLFAAAVFCAWAWSRRRQTRWRREARAELARIADLPTPTARFDGLVALAKSLRPHRPGLAAPAALFQPRGGVTGPEIDAALAEFARRLR